jgi:hypothetical protein
LLFGHDAEELKLSLLSTLAKNKQTNKQTPTGICMDLPSMKYKRSSLKAATTQTK